MIPQLLLVKRVVDSRTSHTSRGTIIQQLAAVSGISTMGMDRENILCLYLNASVHDCTVPSTSSLV
jgi:hypothetical protein